MHKQVLSLLFIFLLMPCLAMAQRGTITGTVTGAESGRALPGVNVVVQETQTGAATNVDGQYKIRIESGTYTLRASFVGYQTERREVTVEAGSTTRVNFELSPSELGLDEVVVTGVAEGRQTANLGFSVESVGEAQLEEVPMSDPANALRGKIAGAQILQGSGDPASNASIRLRGSTSISNQGDQQPLIIVDGVITDGNISDIDMSNVESIEVVKGAAASSIYGSLAADGVIQIRTKRGSDTGNLQVRVRSEYGQSEIAKEYPKATRHPWVLDTIRAERPDGSTVTLIEPSQEELDSEIPKGSKLLKWTGRSQEIVAEDGRFDNRFPVLYDNIDNVFTGKPYVSNEVSISNQGDEYSFLASYSRLNQGGVVEPVDPYKRNSVRLNADYTPGGRLSASFSSSYTNTTAPDLSGEEQGQGDNYFYSVLTADPFMDMTEKNENGEFTNVPTGYSIQNSNWQNPLYVAQQREQEFERNRLIAGATLDFDVTDWLSLHGRQSLDKQWTNFETFYPKGYETPGRNEQINEGFESRGSEVKTTAVSELWTSLNQDFDDLSVEATLKYLFEDRTENFHGGSGSQYSAEGLRNLDALDQSTYDIDSYQQTERAENVFLTTTFNYDNRFIIDGLIRRDGSSSFGPEERWQTYYRGSIAFRVAQQFEIPNVQQFKLRASYGTSGKRPPFEAQYETYNVSSSGISPGVLGNKELKPATAKELELGLNAGFLERFTLEFNYAVTNTEDDYLEVPLSSAVGFNSQWQNVGNVRNTAVEFTFGGDILRGEDLNWRANVTYSRIRQEITDLGSRPAFTRSLPGTALDVFRVEEGQPYGAIFGNKALTSLDQLTVIDGTVLNRGGSSRDDFTVNEYGYVVPAGTKGTPDEQVVYAVDENGEKTTERIGNTQPDFTAGISTNFDYKGFGIYGLLDWSYGGDVYNYTKQLLYFNNQHKDLQEFAADGHHWGYANSSSTIYNQASASSYFVEDASYVKLREVSLSYTLDQSQLSAVFGETLQRVRLSVTGRNLLTFTDYSGWDPEVALRSNSTNFRLDEYSYPNYRTYTGSIELRF